MGKTANTDHVVNALIGDRWSPYGYDSRPVAADDLRSLFEAAVTAHGESAVSLWRAYSRWHAVRGQFDEAAAVHARALRALAPSLHADFVEGA